jgi:DNA polymerase-3 subunit alpha
MNTISSFTVKLDVLGLRGVSVVDDVCKQIGIKISDIDFDDAALYQPLYDLRCPHGLFQIEADVSYMTIRKVKPKNIHELSAVMALARPGALQFIDAFSTYTNTGIKESIHPFFDDVLEKTGGLCLYQEQLLKMANKIGFTLDESEILRRIVGKKKKEEMVAWEAKIEDKVKQNKLDPKIKDVIWKIANDSASYSFNACLSPDTVVETENGYKMLFEIQNGDKVKAYDKDNDEDHFVEVVNKHENHVELYEIEMEDGRKIKASMDHKFMCEDKKMHPLKEIILNKHQIMCN